jgi:hypothetical protein
MGLLHNHMHDFALHVFVDLLRAVVSAAQSKDQEQSSDDICLASIGKVYFNVSGWDQF